LETLEKNYSLRRVPTR